jgi:hypothetical protein
VRSLKSVTESKTKEVKEEKPKATPGEPEKPKISKSKAED